MESCENGTWIFGVPYKAGNLLGIRELLSSVLRGSSKFGWLVTLLVALSPNIIMTIKSRIG